MRLQPEPLSITDTRWSYGTESRNIAHNTTSQYITFTLTGLTYDTEYSITIEPYRVVGTLYEYGISYPIQTVRTQSKPIDTTTTSTTTSTTTTPAAPTTKEGPGNLAITYIYSYISYICILYMQWKYIYVSCNILVWWCIRIP